MTAVKTDIIWNAPMQTYLGRLRFPDKDTDYLVGPIGLNRWTKEQAFEGILAALKDLELELTAH